MSIPYFSVVDHTIMLNYMETVLNRFESCFSRKAAYGWFVTITVGLMLRCDKLGITSIIRDLALSPGCYDSMLHFFRASSWSLDKIRKCWFSAVREYAPVYQEGNRYVLIGDGVKQSKEGRRMPGVKSCSRNPKTLESRSTSMGICLEVLAFWREAPAAGPAFP